jgi:hypothetical protein
MRNMCWNMARNKPLQALEFAAVHDNFAWRKHSSSSRFGVLKNNPQKYANDSLSRAFESEEDSIPQLFLGNNRVVRAKPEYGSARFAVVWYSDEEWAILCNSQEATIIEASLISGFKREKDGAAERINFLQRLFERVEPSVRIPLYQVPQRIT